MLLSEHDRRNPPTFVTSPDQETALTFQDFTETGIVPERLMGTAAEAWLPLNKEYWRLIKKTNQGEFTNPEDRERFHKAAGMRSAIDIATGAFTEVPQLDATLANPSASLIERQRAFDAVTSTLAETSLAELKNSLAQSLDELRTRSDRTAGTIQATIGTTNALNYVRQLRKK